MTIGFCFPKCSSPGTIVVSACDRRTSLTRLPAASFTAQDVSNCKQQHIFRFGHRRRRIHPVYKCQRQFPQRHLSVGHSRPLGCQHHRCIGCEEFLSALFAFPNHQPTRTGLVSWDRTAPIFLFGRICIFPPRPYRFLLHGAQGRVQDDRFFSGRPQGSSLTGRAPCYGWMRQR